MKNTMTKAGIAAIVAATAAISAAQTNGPTGYSVRVGAYFPNTGSSAINVGLDYKINTVRLNRTPDNTLNSYLGISLDYYGNSDNGAIPLALTYNVRASQNFVLSAGIGPSFTIGDRSDVDFGAQVGAAYEFATEGEGSNPIFVQAKYFFGGRSDVSGFAVGVGYRF
ncbi:hypothetical protein EON81_23865 [bacterium]|nr:MAG: hypothetical protein EON81_23865 [bacterium]